MIRLSSHGNMLLIKTYLDKSSIHGLGVFADEFIRKGTKIWRFVEGFDRAFSPREYAKLPKPAREYIKVHGYRVDGEILLTVDHDHHINHAEDANTHWSNGHIVASRDIPKGAEITNSYRLFDAALCAAFLKKKVKPKPKASRSRRRPAVNGHRLSLGTLSATR